MVEVPWGGILRLTRGESFQIALPLWIDYNHDRVSVAPFGRRSPRKNIRYDLMLLHRYGFKIDPLLGKILNKTVRPICTVSR